MRLKARRHFNIKLKLDKSFMRQMRHLSRRYGEQGQKLNGLHKSQLNYTEFIDNFVDKDNVADISIDANANAGQKDIVSLEREMSKPHSKLLAFSKIYYEMKKKYGKKEADKWAKEEWIGNFYLHDFASSTYKPYCFAYDLEPIVEKGLFFIERFNSKPPKHLATYTDFVGETVSWLSNRSSGACGLPNFLIYSFYFWKKDCENNYAIYNKDYFRDQEFQRIIYKLNQPYLRVDQSAFTNFSIFDREYLIALFGGKTFPDGSFVVDYIEDILEYQKAFMEMCSKVRSQNMMTFPVLTFCLLRQNGKFEDEDFAKWCCKHNMKWADSNFFISKNVTSLSNCCRLVSNIENLGYFNSIGGSALEVGSVKVNTINMARIAYETKTQEGYLELLEERVLMCLKTLDRVRHIIKRNIEKKLLPNYTTGLMSLKSQYNTIGIVGVWEAISYLGGTEEDEFGNVSYTEDGMRFASEIFTVIKKAQEEFAKTENIDYQTNVESVPAERCAAILQQKDQMFFKDGVYDLPLYGNQWIPLGKKATLYSKLKASSAMDKMCNGGSIAHINIDTPQVDFEAAWKLLNQIADMDIPYFAFCTRISACKHNHGFYGDVCPTCGGPKLTTYQRIVGFLTPETTYSKERKAEFKLRRFYTKPEQKI